MSEFVLEIFNDSGVSVFDMNSLHKMVLLSKGITTYKGDSNHTIALPGGGTAGPYTLHCSYVDWPLLDFSSNPFAVIPNIFIKLPVGGKVTYYDCYGCHGGTGIARFYIGSETHNTFEYVTAAPLLYSPVTSVNIPITESHLAPYSPLGVPQYYSCEAFSPGNTEGFTEATDYGVEIFDEDGKKTYSSEFLVANFIEHVELPVYNSTLHPFEDTVFEISIPKADHFIGLSKLGITDEYSSFGCLCACVERLSPTQYRFFYRKWSNMEAFYTNIQGLRSKLLDNLDELSVYKLCQFIYHPDL